MADFKVGFVRTDITPDLGVRLGGYGIPERPAEKILEPLYSSALAVSDGTATVVVISVDLVAITQPYTDNVRKEISKSSGIPVENIMVCATHTHSSPDTCEIPGWSDERTGYMASKVPTIIESGITAIKNLQPAKMGVATLPSRVGKNRRHYMDDGNRSSGEEIEGNFDSTMTVARFETLESAPIVTLIHYGAHCTAMGPTREVSRDWPGVMLDRVSSLSNGPAMFVNGACGDVGPRYNVMQSDICRALAGDGIESVKEVGYLAAGDAIRGYWRVEEFITDVPVKACNSNIRINVKPLPPMQEVEEKLVELEIHKDGWGLQKCFHDYWKRVEQAHKQSAVDVADVQSQVIAIGELAFITLPGEVFSSISMRIREGSKFKYSLISGNCNDYLGYIPDAKGRKIGGYEIQMEAARNTYLPQDDSDDAIVQQAVAAMNSLYES